jgi:CubicO group peptidase (beta-lactamase class C family)
MTGSVVLQAAPSDRISDTVQARMASDGVPGVVVVVLENGVPAWTRAFGYADPARGREMTADALFRVESISKIVTAWGAMRLAEVGRLDLDAPATDCLPRWTPPGGTPDVTARRLLSHTAGLGLGDFTARYPPGADRPSNAAHLARGFEVIAAPGTGFAYSDTGYNLLELMIETCSGREFGAFLSAEVLAPLGMDSARYNWPLGDMPIGHDLRGRPVAPYVYPGRGSGGLLATAGDIARLAAAEMEGAPQSVLLPSAVDAMHQPAVAVGGLFGFAADGYGLGHFTEELSDGRRAVWHGGQGYGWMSHMHLVPETGDGLIVLTNSQRAWPLFAEVLQVWSESLGVHPLGMTRILWLETVTRLVMLLLGTLAVLALWRTSRRSSRTPVLRGAACALSAALIGWPLWAANQDYLFLFSILPGLWPWLAGLSGITGLCLAAFAVGPGGRRLPPTRT